MELNFNGISVTRRGDTIFIPLPRAAWRSCGTCNCPHCKGAPAFWDTLAVAATSSRVMNDNYTWTVHAPELHRRDSMPPVTIIGSDSADPDMLSACYSRIARWETATRADVYVSARKSSGWLEYGVAIYRDDTRLIYLAAIQREPGADIEFHS